MNGEDAADLPTPSVPHSKPAPGVPEENCADEPGSTGVPMTTTALRLLLHFQEEYYNGPYHLDLIVFSVFHICFFFMQIPDIIENETLKNKDIFLHNYDNLHFPT